MKDHIQFAYALSGGERGRSLHEDAEIANALRQPDLAWLHMAASHEETRPWIEEHLSYLDPSILGALLAQETRPRVMAFEEGLLVILRGINLNPGAEPEDMVSIRIWLDAARIVSLSQRYLRSLWEVAEAAGSGDGPRAPSDFLETLLQKIIGRIETHLSDLDDRVDELEETVIDGADPRLRVQITDMRLETTELRRYISPQRDALADLVRAPVTWFDEADRRRLGELHQRMVRSVEELDSIRERLQTLRDELANAMDERLNRNLYALSMISAIFLPLGFLTGLMGINLGGIPGAENPNAFWIFTGGVTVLMVAMLGVLRWLRWI
ncbi:zinc transporter ZntB [Profundibacterium mesophilum]|uniref:CmaX protein n=1 Tax=Profundibacterium mesophilum KAUST100406-0324 TaxID=1037889 RepID=A0A921TB02_9RHOB|nr:zinc transporter ZntB [Profundibacterium mesophilum]KAF0674520.1 CmaX protein [Profundibacterium mesophilum KAUST100406-0324]